LVLQSEKSSHPDIIVDQCQLGCKNCYSTQYDDDNNHQIKSLSARVWTLPIDSIKIGKRFRRDLGDVDSLAKSIEQIGLVQPVVVTEDRKLIAGQRRIEACKKLGWTEVPVHLVNIKEIVKGEFHENVVRKDFSYSEMIAIKREIEPLEREESLKRQRQGQKLGGKLHHSINANTNIALLGENFTPSKQIEEKGKTDDKLAGLFGLSRPTFKKIEEIHEAAKEQPEKYGQLWKKVDDKRIKPEKAYRQIQKDKKIAKLLLEANANPTISLPERTKLINGDSFEYTKDLSDNSIDLIFTDPPYGLGTIPLYRELAKIAARVLKPGGSLVTYLGQYALFETAEALGRDTGLNYNWIFAIIHTGPSQEMHRNKVFVTWKPVLWYFKGDKLGNSVDYIADSVKSSPPN
jgi:ParB-like chromosome segregation protein Spo0J